MRWVLVLAALLNVVAAPAALASEASSKESPSGDSSFINMRALIVPILQDRRVRGLMEVAISLYLKDPSQRPQVELMQPKLTDRYIMALNLLGQTAIEVDRPINFSLLESVLQRSTDAVLGPDVARVLIVDAASRAQD